MAEGKAVSLVFRIAAVVLSVAAAVVMGTASQLIVVGGGRGSSSSYVVSYSHYNALVYFVAAGAISAVCSALALYTSAVREATIGSLPLVPLLDAIAQALLFSAAGAAFAARGVVGVAAGPWGSPGSVCDAAGAFCGRVSTAAAIGVFAAAAVAVAALTSKDARRSSGSCCDLG
ncbi:CASP-like protein 1U1 [Phragmites australis]|uniref:CASP-like protein 1U1 n=1 Tax=Phragmites australis TaxID=29695 RepID=UPI002D79F099|nr:CASP-like protein 1U1 [Phragmites australis]